VKFQLPSLFGGRERGVKTRPKRVFALSHSPETKAEFTIRTAFLRGILLFFVKGLGFYRMHTKGGPYPLMLKILGIEIFAFSRITPKLAVPNDVIFIRVVFFPVEPHPIKGH